MDTPHLHRRGLRRTVWVTLVAWLWALTASLVNGCVLAPQGSGASDVAFGSHLPSAMYSDPVGTRSDPQGSLQSPPAAQHGHEQDSGKGACLKFCDDGSSALSKHQTATLDPGAMLAYALQPWTPIAPITRVGIRRSVERPASIGPPLVIRFLRLTL